MSNYYLIGTKYGNPNNINVAQDFKKSNVIAIGFAWKTNLTKFYNHDPEGLELLLRNLGETPLTIGQIKRFMQIRPVI